MFGYVKPDKGELLVKEYEFYRAAYCGICRCMKRYTGSLSNLLHSYDSVFLALTRMLYIDRSRITAKAKKCIAHPFTKRPMLDENPALEYTAKAFGILTYYKLLDDGKDEQFIKRIAVGCIKPIFSSAKKRAELPELCEIVKDRLDKLSALEKERVSSVDKPAGLFGELLGEIFAYGFSDENRDILYNVGFYLGKFIYAADAAEDYDDDLKSESYNPYVLLYENRPLTDENRSTVKCSLLLICRELEAAVNKLPFGDNISIENILKNIIYLGLPERIAFLDAQPSGAAPIQERKEDNA